FYVGTERESSPGEAALQLFSADAPNVRLHVAPLDYPELPDEPIMLLLSKNLSTISGVCVLA
ncbi:MULTISPECIES: hypothetical protein, partial [unclassified Microcoleus]